jgi:hypothetical protein
MRQLKKSQLNFETKDWRNNAFHSFTPAMQRHFLSFIEFAWNARYENSTLEWELDLIELSALHITLHCGTAAERPSP